MTVTESSPRRRTELAAFLRSRRERIAPADVGMAPGTRRRTPGLRREEVAQLAGVGVTWYTWLEQGRPINASAHVLDAIARTLRLDATEREHLYRLAGMPMAAAPADDGPLEPAVQVILDGLSPLPASVYNSRYDLLAWNAAFDALFPGMTSQPAGGRNVLVCAFTTPSCCHPMANRADELPLMVATLRAAFARHVGEPAWTSFVRRLSAASPEFTRMWANHDVAAPGTRSKLFQHQAIGLVRMSATSLSVAATPETRMVVYTPRDEESRTRIEWLVAHPEARPADHTH